MKKLFVMMAISATIIGASACGNNPGGGAGTGDSSANAVKPADNSSATNPSMADTAYSKNNADSSRRDSTRKDSSRLK